GGTFGEGQNNVDVIYAGNAGADLHWGAGLGISRSKTSVASDRQTSVSSYEARGGIHSDRWEAFGGLVLGGESKTELGGGVDSKLSESFGLRAGGGFQIVPEFRVFANAAYDHYNATQTKDGPDYDGKRTALGVGGVYLRSLEENARLFASAEIKYLENKAGGNKGLEDEKYNLLEVPVTLGIEADANSWARVRASVRQGILVGQTKTTTGNTPNNNNKWENAPNSTSVAAGVGASANRFNFDVALAQALVDDGAHVEVAMTYIF
ncbi:MAG: outer membrane beta-barrel protein, partial [Bdellovibrionales bacterium]